MQAARNLDRVATRSVPLDYAPPGRGSRGDRTRPIRRTRPRGLLSEPRHRRLTKEAYGWGRLVDRAHRHRACRASWRRERLGWRRVEKSDANLQCTRGTQCGPCAVGGLLADQDRFTKEPVDSGRPPTKDTEACHTACDRGLRPSQSRQGSIERGHPEIERVDVERHVTNGAVGRPRPDLHVRERYATPRLRCR